MAETETLMPESERPWPAKTTYFIGRCEGCRGLMTVDPEGYAIHDPSSTCSRNFKLLIYGNLAQQGMLLLDRPEDHVQRDLDHRAQAVAGGLG